MGNHETTATPAANGEKKNPHEWVITVNTREVRMASSRVTGMDIKSAAVAQGVPGVATDFLLLLVSKHGEATSIADDETVTINEHSVFKMLAADDNSEV